MAILKQRTAIAVTVGLWLAAAGSAAALGRHLSRGPDPRPPVFEGARSFGEPARAPLAEQRVLYVGPVVITAPWPKSPVSVRAPAPSTPIARDVYEMGCTHSRELDIGSGRVEFCE
jgi:hypothetical protein